MPADPATPHLRPHCAGIVLAAGLSARFGGDTPKQLALWQGEPLVRRMAREALRSGLAEVLVVVGHRRAEVREALEGLAVRFVENPDFATGKAGSVRAGIAALGPAVVAAMVLPCDQPFLDAAVIDHLLAAFDAGTAPLIVPACRGRRGAPVILARRFFPELAALRGDAGGKEILARYPQWVREVELSDERALLDVDTAAELRQWEDAGPEA